MEKREKKFLQNFLDEIERISQNPFENSCDIKPLTNQKDHYRLRIGKYRFLYEVRKNEILVYVYDTDSRGSIYK